MSKSKFSIGDHVLYCGNDVLFLKDLADSIFEVVGIIPAAGTTKDGEQNLSGKNLVRCKAKSGMVFLFLENQLEYDIDVLKERYAEVEKTYRNALLPLIKQRLKEILPEKTKVLDFKEMIDEEIVLKFIKNDGNGSQVYYAVGLDDDDLFVDTFDIENEKAKSTFYDFELEIKDLESICGLISDVQYAVRKLGWRINAKGETEQIKWRRIGCFNDPEDILSLGKESADEIVKAMLDGKGHFHPNDAPEDEGDMTDRELVTEYESSEHDTDVCLYFTEDRKYLVANMVRYSKNVEKDVKEKGNTLFIDVYVPVEEK